MRKSEEDLQKVTLNLFAGDMGKLQELYPDVGAGAVIRRVVRRFIEQIESGSGQDFDPKVEVNI